MEKVKPFAFNGIALTLASPVVAYVILRCFNAAVACWKIGWDSRPFIYVSPASILVFVLYALATIVGTGWLWKLTQQRVVGCCAILIGTMLLIYWIGFLTWIVGVLPDR